MKRCIRLYRVKTYLSIMRFSNSLLTGLTIVFSIIVYSKWMIDVNKIVIGFITGYTGSASAMCINDYIDAPVDSINKPWKPIPSGLVNRRNVLYMSIALLLSTILINVLINYKTLLVASIYVLIAYTYSFLRKQWWSQLIVPLSTTAPLIYGYIVSNHPLEYLSFTVLFSATMFSATLVREIVKAIIDIEGDLKYNYSTIPIKYGLDNAKKLIIINTIVSVTLGYLSGLTINYRSTLYFILFTISSFIYLNNVFKAIKNIDNKIILDKTRKNILIAMSIALLAFLSISFQNKSY
uniref:Geranylgeranylglyceryl phosphate synthase n=1 Tax=Staphylothermus marinus TaxID=2280 RepID=A0A7C4H678_STAMA